MARALARGGLRRGGLPGPGAGATDHAGHRVADSPATRIPVRRPGPTKPGVHPPRGRKAPTPRPGQPEPRSPAGQPERRSPAGQPERGQKPPRPPPGRPPAPRHRGGHPLPGPQRPRSRPGRPGNSSPPVQPGAGEQAARNPRGRSAARNPAVAGPGRRAAGIPNLPYGVAAAEEYRCHAPAPRLRPARGGRAAGRRRRPARRGRRDFSGLASVSSRTLCHIPLLVTTKRIGGWFIHSPVITPQIPLQFRDLPSDVCPHRQSRARLRPIVRGNPRSSRFPHTFSRSCRRLVRPPVHDAFRGDRTARLALLADGL